jgi:hypothetical protein
MDDIYLDLHRKLASMNASNAQGGDVFSSGSMDSFLGGKTPMTRSAYIQGDPAQLEVLRDPMLELVAVLRAQYWIVQNAHWQVRGDSFYGDHQMFERIYDETAKDIDSLAEKAVGYLGCENVDAADLINRAKKWVDKWCRVDCPVSRTLAAEKDFLTLSKAYYVLLKEAGVMTLGLDDEIMSIANRHEGHVYLLQQRLDNIKRASVKRVARTTKPPRRLRVSNLGDLTGFLRVSNDVLIRKCEKDLWKVTKDADGNHVIEKLYDGDVLNY